jgi:hypothetical protein
MMDDLPDEERKNLQLAIAVAALHAAITRSSLPVPDKATMLKTCFDLADAMMAEWKSRG